MVVNGSMHSVMSVVTGTSRKYIPPGEQVGISWLGKPKAKQEKSHTQNQGKLLFRITIQSLNLNFLHF